MILLDGSLVAQSVYGSLAKRIDSFEKKYSRKPCLAVVLAGNNPASITYVKAKKKKCDACGISHRDFVFEETVSEQELLNLIHALNEDDGVDGILVQLPLPAQVCEEHIINAICPDKDADGFTPYNAGRILIGQSGPVACTPKGIMRILDFYGIDLDGKNVCILGRSNIVGKPMAALMLQKNRNATVTVCNSHTPDIKSFVKKCDVLISAVGCPGLISANMVKKGVVVIDVGMNRVPDSSKKSGYTLKGDVDFEKVSKKAAAITPVPGGVGPMTIAMLLENTVDAAFALKEKI